MPSASGSHDESNFLIALKGNKIAFSHVETLKEVLRLIFIKVGLRADNLPKDEERYVLLSHIVSEYGNHTTQEIKLAFDMAIAGKLELDRKDVICYENFSCLYFSTIMNAYRKWSAGVYRETKTEPLQVEEQKELSQQEKDEWITDVKSKEVIKLHEIPFMFYEWLNLTNYEEYLNKAFDVCKQQVIEANEIPAVKEKRLAEFTKGLNEGFEGELRMLIILTAKKIAVWHHFKK